MITGTIYDIVKRRKFPGGLIIENGRIKKVLELSPAEVQRQVLLPGFVDAHIHIESSLLTPREFWRMAVGHGTLATVSDPHEIANVLGVSGVKYMIDNLRATPFNTCWGAPSCVPATNFEVETAGARFSIREICALLDLEQVGYLAEVMNFPAVLARDPEIMSFIQAAVDRGKPVDGHAPGLRGEAAGRYAEARISTDHECSTIDEALDKIAAGMKIIIREGSAAKNYQALKELLRLHPEQVMLCSDDKHPHELSRGHINQLVQRALADGFDEWAVLRAATLNPVRHYGLTLGLLQPGDPADFIVVDDISSMTVRESYLRGDIIAEGGQCLLDYETATEVNRFAAHAIRVSDLELRAQSSRVRSIGVIDGQLLTTEQVRDAVVSDGLAVASPARNLLKIAVINRYEPAPPAVGFCENLGLHSGAIASSVAHDSHNIVSVGCSDEEIARALNLVIGARGGISVVSGQKDLMLPLPIAGLMANSPGEEAASLYEELHRAVGELGSDFHDALMMLSFLALPVIGELKMTDKGLFSLSRFSRVDLFV